MSSLLMALLAISCHAQQSIDNREKEVVFRNVDVIPMDRNVVLRRQDVVVKGGIITAIGPTTKIKYSNDAHVVDGKGRYLLPGLAEMHAHVPPVDELAPMEDVVKLFALMGIT
ncbi:MAG TPA: hypothetical protein VEB42_06185, partial [Chitinophagaceae bacterium]|nr:hypothetical protein [Chitinophagaceae bacterium]